MISSPSELPLVSVILPVRNGAKYISDAIASVLNGSYSNLELLVIDGNSTDATKDIVLSYPPARFIPQAGAGIAAAFNQGLKEAKADLLAFIAHDDVWSSDKLSLQVQRLSEDDSMIVVGRAEFFLEPGATSPAGFRPELLLEPKIAFIMETLLARRAAFESIGVFDTTLATAEDVDWFARARDAGLKQSVVDSVLVRKRIHGNNSSMTEANNTYLLQALKKSVARKRGTTL